MNTYLQMNSSLRNSNSSGASVNNPNSMYPLMKEENSSSSGNNSSSNYPSLSDLSVSLNFN